MNIIEVKNDCSSDLGPRHPGRFKGMLVIEYESADSLTVLDVLEQTIEQIKSMDSEE